MVALTSKRRNALPKKDFALPGKAPASGSYPIDTANRARNALSRAAQHASPAEQATIKRKVAAKFPGIAVSGSKKGGKK